MAHISRRTVMVAGVTAAATAAVGINTGTASAALGARGLPTGGSFVQIVAHTDDDLLFLNPDIQPSILSGRPVRTIVLGADEYNGVDGAMTREQLAASVQEGSRSAYAVLAGKPNNWTRDTLEVAGKIVEIDTLVGAPQLQLIYLSLPDGGDDLHIDALTNLWADPSHVTDTILPEGSPVGVVQQYNQADLNAVLLELLQQYQPTVVRVQDPHPDDARNNSLPDHWDHVASAQFGELAVKAYEGPNGRPFTLLTRYRCYNTQAAPANVPPALLTPKTDGYRAYGAHDPLSGDAFDLNLARAYERWPVVAPWAAIDSTGVLHAFVVAGDSVMMWKQPNGGAWVGPTNLRAGTHAPGVAVALRGDGKLQIAVLDLSDGSVITARQTAAGGGFGTWTSVGNPDGATPAYGTPAFGVNSDGGLELYVVDKAGMLSNAYEEGAGWSSWSTVTGGGGKAMTPPVAITAPSGKLHVFADGNGKTLHWYQNPGGSTTFQALTATAESTFAPGMAVEPSGKVRIVSREQSDGAVGTLAEKTANGAWATALTHIGGQGGVGPVSAVTSGGTTPRVLAFARNDGYGISVSRQASSGAFGAWEDLGGYGEVGPAAVRDAMGKVRVFVVGGDARLYERVQTAVGPDGAFGAWQQAGS